MPGISVKAIHFTYEVPIYIQDVLFILGYSREKASQIVKRYGGSDSIVRDVYNLKTCAGVCMQDEDTGRFLIYMEDLPRTSGEHSTLIHEMFHLTEQILDRVGVKHDYQVSSEAYAYLLGQISADVLCRLWTATNI